MAKRADILGVLFNKPIYFIAYTIMKYSKNTFTILSLSFFLSSIFFSCQGPEGPQGLDGNANVISINYLILASDWQEVGKPGEVGFLLAVDLDVPEITQDIVDHGLVLAYYRATDSDPWTALPFTRISHDPPFSEKFDFIYDRSFVGLTSMATDRGGTPYEGTVRLIVAEAIPVGKTSIDYANYEEVAAYLDLSNIKQLYRVAN